MNKIAWAYNEFLTKVLQNLSFRRVRERIDWHTQWNSHPRMPCKPHLMFILRDVSAVFVYLPVFVFVSLPVSTHVAVCVSVSAAGSEVNTGAKPIEGCAEHNHCTGCMFERRRRRIPSAYAAIIRGACSWCKDGFWIQDFVITPQALEQGCS